MQLVPEDDLRDGVDVFAEVLVEQQRLRHLQVVQVLQDGLQLALEDLMELLSDFNAAIDLRKLLDAVYEELKFLEDLPQDLDVLVIHWLVQEVVEAEATGNDEH